MSRKRHFITGLSTLILLSALDLISTWILTPDLTEEANAFVRWYGFGWFQIILKNAAVILFVSIPFYFHSVIFGVPAYNYKPSMWKVIEDYFFGNHPHWLVSLGRSLFNILGYFLFWWYFIQKLTAVTHNTLHICNAAFWKMSFGEQMMIIDRFSFWFLVVVMLLFVIRLLANARSGRIRQQSVKKFNPLFFILFVSLYISFRLFIAYAKPIHVVEFTTGFDTDITLVNIGEADRKVIADYITTIQSHKPAVLGIDVLFFEEKDWYGDSTLEEALSISMNDILAASIDKELNVKKPYPGFSERSETGIVEFKEVGAFTSHITPVWKVKDSIYEDFSLKILKKWKPGFEIDIKPNRSIPVKFSRQQNQFRIIHGEILNEIDPVIITNKIVLLGYIGPSEEDMHFTPIELIDENSPGTYGVIIVANAIRTLIEYEKSK